MEANLLSVTTALGDYVSAASTSADHQDNPPCEFTRFSKINRVGDPAILSVPQPFVRSIVGCPPRELGIMIVSVPHHQVVETPSNLRTTLHIPCQSLIEGDNLLLRPVG